ncbi:hypothetical protein, partial [Paraburkholderia silvatlantica]|uniref:hypothetical protein n=1 Tax=Paraburkholderia silvatlantica TaxID=321895 RepID=UPI00360E8142
ARARATVEAVIRRGLQKQRFHIPRLSAQCGETRFAIRVRPMACLVGAQRHAIASKRITQNIRSAFRLACLLSN